MPRPAKQPQRLPAAQQAQIPRRVRPALAQPVETPPAGNRWLHEIKLDGYRMFCRKSSSGVTLLSRNNQDWTQRFAALVTEAERLSAKSALLDGELVVIHRDGNTSFQALQNALSQRDLSKLRYFVFDLLYLDGYDLTSLPLIDRKQALRQLLEDSAVEPIVYCDHIEGDGPTVFEHARSMGVEGIISKRRDRPYRPSRSPDWKKAKCLLSDDFVIGGYTLPSKPSYGFGALLVGQPTEKGLAYAGRVGTGFSQATRDHLQPQLRQRKVKDTPFYSLPADEGGKDVRFVVPELIAHVVYLEKTGSNILRHASFQGLREDLTLGDVAATKPKHSAHTNSGHMVKLGELPDSLADLDNIRFTHPDKPLYLKDGVTKLDLAKYYAQVADSMIPHIAGRPLSLVRSCKGIERRCYFQKRPPKGLAEHVKRVEIPSGDRTATAMMVDNAAGLLSLIQFDVVEIHTWSARVDRLDRPDRIVFDLDPDESVSWERVKQAALDLREFLKERGLSSNLLVTGGKGLHVIVPIVRRYSWDRVKDFTHQTAKEFAAAHSGGFTTSPSLAARKGKIFVDYLRNQRGATSIAPYSTRARAGAPVAMPLAWDDLDSLRSPAIFKAGYLSQIPLPSEECWSMASQSLPR